MVFDLDLYAWPSFMFSRKLDGHFSPWESKLMPICNFRYLASAHPWIDVGRAAIDRGAVEGTTDSPPVTVTVAAEGEGEYRYESHDAWGELHALIYGRQSLIEEVAAMHELWRHGHLTYINQCEVTL